MKPITGTLNGGTYWVDTGYRSLWCAMLEQSIEHSKGKQLTKTAHATRKAWVVQEVFISRCHILSDLFTEDCYLIGWGDDIIESIRQHCAQFWNKTGCVVCGKGDDKLCWEHKKAVGCFNEGRDSNYKYVEEREVEQYELELEKRDKVKIREMTEKELALF